MAILEREYFEGIKLRNESAHGMEVHARCRFYQKDNESLIEAVEVLAEALENISYLHYDTDKMYQDFSNEALEKVWGKDEN